MQVDDYRLDPMTGERQARFRVLQGAMTTHRMRTGAVDSELARGCVGILDHSGTFVSLSPWLLFEACPICKREELFMVDGVTADQVVYVSMESGHKSPKDELTEYWWNVIREARELFSQDG